ncbi:hypothetical protein [Streptomyces canus]|uniref:hypothetical protein n=1 Tax=Streptomyces canus TaxID=58343 RepID=UPI0033B28EA2
MIGDAGHKASRLTAESLEHSFVYQSTKLPPEIAADPLIVDRINKNEELRRKAKSNPSN